MWKRADWEELAFVLQRVHTQTHTFTKVHHPHSSGLFPDSSVGKESICDAGDPGSIPGSGKSPEEGIGYPLQYSWTSLVAQLVKKPPTMWRPGFNPWVGKIPRRRGRLPIPVFWPGEFHGLYSPWGHKESDTTEQLSLPLNVRIKFKKKLYLKKKGVAYFTCACRRTAHPAPWKTKITLCFKKETTVLRGEGGRSIIQVKDNSKWPLWRSTGKLRKALQWDQ